MTGRPFLHPAAPGAAPSAQDGRQPPEFALALLPALLQASPFAPAVDAADWAFHSATFWSVLAVLLSAGCIYYLIRWLYERRVLQQQENLHRLYGLAEIILESHDPDTVHKEVAEVANLVGGGTQCHVLILNPSAQQLDYVAGTGPPPLAAVSLSAISGPVTCFRSQLLTEVPDAEACPFVKTEIVRRLGQKALLYVPIIAAGACLGVIEIEDRRQKRIFTRQQKTRAQHVARLAALGLRLGDQRTVQVRLHRTEKMAVVSELIEGVTETLATPLRRLSELAGGSGESNPSEAAARLKEVSREARRAMTTVERLERLTRSRRGQPQEIDLHQVLEAVHERWLEDGRRLHLNLSGSAPKITADLDHVEQVLLNLLQHGEQLLEGIAAQSLQVTTSLLEKTVIISIGPADEKSRRDVEPRLADEERLLEPESSLRLAVCQNLVEGFGGTLRVESRAKRGFRIELRYPLAGDSSQRAKSAAPRLSSNGVPSLEMTALVIDSDPAVQDALLYMLTERAYRVIPVSTAEEALDLCEHARFDCVFFDALSGGGGPEAYDRIRSFVGRFVFLADTTFAVENGGFPADHCAVLRKPIEPAELDRLLQSFAPGAEMCDSTEKQPAATE